MPDNKINPKHSSIRSVLRLIGPAMMLLGAACIIGALVDFVMAMNGNGSPTLFWLFFIGGPLLVFGFAVTSMAFMGAVMRYQAQEAAPVAADTVNYMADGTQQGMKTVARAVGAGLAEGLSAGQASSSQTSSGSGSDSALAASHSSTAPAKVILCHKCNAENPPGARFCNSCAAPLGKTRPCAACGELNDPDARFCDNCGGVM